MLEGLNCIIPGGDLYWEPTGSNVIDKPVGRSEVLDAFNKGLDIFIVDTDGKMYKALSVYEEDERAAIRILDKSATSSGTVSTRVVFSFGD